MNKYLYLTIILLLFMLSSLGCGVSLQTLSESVASIEIDTDSNDAIDVNRGGTNSTTASGAIVNLGLDEDENGYVDLDKGGTNDSSVDKYTTGATRKTVVAEATNPDVTDSGTTVFHYWETNGQITYQSFIDGANDASNTDKYDEFEDGDWFELLFNEACTLDLSDNTYMYGHNNEDFTAAVGDTAFFIWDDDLTKWRVTPSAVKALPSVSIRMIDAADGQIGVHDEDTDRLVPEYRYHNRCYPVEDPIAGTIYTIDKNLYDRDLNFDYIWGESDQTVNFDLQIDDGSPADVIGSDLSPAAGEASTDTFAGDDVLASMEELDLAITSVSGTPTYFRVCYSCIIGSLSPEEETYTGLFRWNGENASGTNYADINGSSLAGVNTDLTISTSYGESGEYGSFHDSPDERLTWTQTADQYIDDDAAQSVMFRAYITGIPDNRVYFFESYVDSNNYFALSIEPTTGYLRFQVKNGTDGIVNAYGTTTSQGTWINIGISWDPTNGDISVYNGGAWDEDQDVITAAFDSSPTSFSLGNVQIYQAAADESVRINAMEIINGYEASVPTW